MYKQHVKHLRFDHSNNVAKLKIDAETALKEQNDNYRQKEHQMKKMNKKVKSEMKEQEISHEDLAKNLKTVRSVIW